MTEEELKRFIRSQTKALQSKARIAVRPAPRPIPTSTIGMPDPVNWTQRAKDIVTGGGSLGKRINPLSSIARSLGLFGTGIEEGIPPVGNVPHDSAEGIA